MLVNVDNPAGLTVLHLSEPANFFQSAVFRADNKWLWVSVSCQTDQGVLGHLFVGSGHFMAEENKSVAFLNLCPKAE